METTTEEKLSLTAEERIKSLEKEKRELRGQVIREREEKKRIRQNKTKSVEEYNEAVKGRLNRVLNLIYSYNKLAKNKRYEQDIFKELIDISIILKEEIKNNGRERKYAKDCA